MALPQAQLTAETIAQALAQLIGRGRSECTNAMLSVALPQAPLNAVTIAHARAAHRLQSSEYTNAMLSVASPQAQLTAVAIIPTRAARWRLVSCGSLAAVGTAYDDNAIGGLVEDNAHGCDDKQACVAHRAAMPSLWRSAHSLFRSNNVWRYAATVELSSQFIQVK